MIVANAGTDGRERKTEEVLPSFIFTYYYTPRPRHPRVVPKNSNLKSHWIQEIRFVISRVYQISRTQSVLETNCRF